MDRNRDGLVNYNDFRVLFNSLRFVTKEKEYQRLLELLGFKPGSTINYAEFYSKIRSDRKTGINLITSMTWVLQTSNTLWNNCIIMQCKVIHIFLSCVFVSRADQLLDRACEQVHAYLVATAQTRGSELSKVNNAFKSFSYSLFIVLWKL